ncbi:MAG TPA: PQQ-binding-like beta-propeller repeat protein [Steroidobacteraceae bacterium]|nr:PQQ-binding-like beta-propeller repeat protein [Steroidobacteraceae bacterium]
MKASLVVLRSLLAAALVVVAPAFSAESATFRGDAQRSGLVKGSGVPALSGVKWKFKTRGAVLSSPAVADGIIYFGSSDHFVYAVNAKTGDEVWKTRTSGRVVSSAAVADGRVYIASYDSHLYSLDAKSGEVRWKFKTAGEHRFTARHLHGSEPAAELMADPFDFYLSSPLVASGVVYFGSGDGNVYAVQAASGELKWKFQTGDVVHASPALANGLLYVGSWDSFFYALDATSGKEKWRYKTGEDRDIYNQVGIQSSAVVANGVVYFGCRDSNVYALDAATGAERWKFSNQGSWVISTPIVSNGKLYFATSDSGIFQALHADSGLPVFTLKLKWPMFSSPAIAGSVLYIGSHSGKLLAVDLKGQKLAWEFATDGSKQNGATYTTADGAPNYEAAFVDFFHDDMVVGVDKMMSVGAVLSSPAVVGDTIYFGSTDGNLYAVG